MLELWLVEVKQHLLATIALVVMHSFCIGRLVHPLLCACVTVEGVWLTYVNVRIRNCIASCNYLMDVQEEPKCLCHNFVN